MNKLSRASGVLMHVSTLPGEYSEGSFGKEAKNWIDLLVKGGFSYWQVLPFCLPDECNSPYKSYSAFSLNPYFIDLEVLFEKGLLTKEELFSARQKTPYYCEFDELAETRLPLLFRAASRFKAEDKIKAFFSKHPQCEKFCEFMALKKANGEKEWQEWTEKTPDAQTLSGWRFIMYEFFAQWTEIKKYANEKGVKIIGDVPIYVSLDSSDVWSEPKQFQLDENGRPSCVAGVPPDYFAEEGQLWGNPLYDWDYMKADGYSWWLGRMKFMSELFDGVRIDHFRGLESYWSVPASEKTAKNGKWVKGPGLDFVEKIKKECGGMLIIAEDLGDITEEVRQLVEESGLPGMRVLQFAFLGEKNSPHQPHNYPANCVAYTGTHDNNTLLGYVWEQTEEDRKALLEYSGFGGEDWNKCYPDIIRMMFASHAGLVILPVQDLLLYGSDTRLNRPGTAKGNWSLRFTREQLNLIDTENYKKLNKIYSREGN